MTDPQVELSVVRVDGERRLRAVAAEPAHLADFEGETGSADGDAVVVGALNARNAAAVRRHRPALRPAPVGLVRSAGTGDRLGLSTPGHARAFRAAGDGVVPVFAQQSARELERTGRTPQEVLDAATFGLLEAGWSGPHGADADHIQAVAQLDAFLAAGFTTVSLDPGAIVQDVAGDPTREALARVPWDALEDDEASFVRRHTRTELDLGVRRLRITESDARRAAAKYGAAIVHLTALYRHAVDHAPGELEVEIAVDEVDPHTSPEDHVILATELQRRDVRWVGFAPRFAGRFEKGVEYEGELAQLRDDVRMHAAVAQQLGPYKLSLHSGSDKFSIYETVVDASGGLVHLKTSGTTYLVALALAADRDPELFRDIYRRSADAYRSARSTYHVSAMDIPDLAAVPDGALEDLVTRRASRQMLHVGYGSVLGPEPDGARPPAAAALHAVLEKYRPDYDERLEAHLGRHLIPFANWRSV